MRDTVNGIASSAFGLSPSGMTGAGGGAIIAKTIIIELLRFR